MFRSSAMLSLLSLAVSSHALAGEIFFRGAGDRTIEAYRCNDPYGYPPNDFDITMEMNSTDVEVASLPARSGVRFTLRVRETGDSLTTLFFAVRGEDCGEGVRSIRFSDGVELRSLADVRELARTRPSGGVSGLDGVETENDLRHLLDETQPRFWRDLSRTGEQEAIATFFELRNSQDDHERAEHFLSRALRFAAVNDAIYDRASLLSVLEPELSRALGWGEREGADEAQKAADELAAMGTGHHGVFASISEFERAYRAVVDRHMTGR